MRDGKRLCEGIRELLFREHQATAVPRGFITVSSSKGTKVRRSMMVMRPGKFFAAALAQYTPMP
jgi:hypothetical protein